MVWGDFPISIINDPVVNVSLTAKTDVKEKNQNKTAKPILLKLLLELNQLSFENTTNIILQMHCNRLLMGFNSFVVEFFISMGLEV